MSTQPSEHAMRASLIQWAPVAAIFDEEATPESPSVIQLAQLIDTHAVEPATSELREALARIQGLTMSHVVTAADGFQLCREIAAVALSKHKEKA